VNSQYFRHDPLNRNRLMTTQFLQLLADRCKPIEGSKPDGPKLRGVNLSVAADDANVLIQKSRFEQRRQAVDLFGGQFPIRVVHVVQVFVSLTASACVIPRSRSNGRIGRNTSLRRRRHVRKT
jgi:hypothetical protein